MYKPICSSTTSLVLHFETPPVNICRSMVDAIIAMICNISACPVGIRTHACLPRPLNQRVTTYHSLFVDLKQHPTNTQAPLIEAGKKKYQCCHPEITPHGKFSGAQTNQSRSSSSVRS